MTSLLVLLAIVVAILFAPSWVDSIFRGVIAEVVCWAYRQATKQAAEAEKLCQHEAAAIEAQSRRDLAEARAQFLRSLSQTERGLLAVRLREAADADARARAAFDFDRLKKEKAGLERAIAALKARNS